MTYADELGKISRTPVTLVVITLDYCGRTFSVDPCLATGTKCWNTWKTCKYKSAYLKQSKDYKFTSADTPLPFKTGERPYLQRVKYLPTEIKDSLTVNAREIYEFYDVPDTDVGIDPYVTTRSAFPTIPGTFWKKLIARNPNYKGRTIKRYEGALGLAENEFEQKFVGVLDNITLGKGETKVETVDLLKSLANVEIPPKVDIKLVSDTALDSATITLTTLAGLYAAPAYIRIKDDIIYYTGTAGGNQITGCAWGQFGSTKEAHRAKDKVQPVRYIPPTNGFDIMKTLLEADAGIDPADVDTAAFDYWKAWPDMDVNFSAIISEPTKADKLYFELVDLLDCKSWVAEDLKITIKRNVPNEPGRGYKTITDAANIIHGSASVDLNEKSRITRMLLYWDRTAIGKVADVNSYNRLDIGLDSDAEGDNDYNDIVEKKVFCRWLRSGYETEEIVNNFIKDLLARQVWRQRDAMPILQCSLELKDSDIKTGQFTKVSTDELLQPDGNPIDKVITQVIRREMQDRLVKVKLLQLTPRRLAYIAADDTPDYDSASDAQKEYAFITDDDGVMADRTDGYYTY
ncbi:MAG: hypothetical protein AB1805_07625 [Nitrospirota bacterium]